MSENVLEYNFSNTKKPKSIKSVINKISKLHSITDEHKANLSHGRDGTDYYISMWVDDVADLPTAEVISYLSSFPNDKVPHAKLQLDTTGETFYYALEENSLMSFDSEKDLSEHFDGGDFSIENEFYEKVDKKSSHLFLRMNLSKKKKLNALLDASTKYINEKSDSSYQAFKEEAGRESQFNKDFPKTYNYCDKKKDYAFNPAKFLMFSKSDKNYLYLGFEFDGDIKIEPCKEGEESWNADRNIQNGDGNVILELVESLLYISFTKSISAKFESSKKGFSGHFWSREGAYLEYMPRWNLPPKPAKFW